MKKNRKDRKDGRFLGNLDGFHYIMPFLMPKRCDSEVYLEEKIDVTNIVKYLEERNKNNPENKITLFHIITTAIAKVVYNRPVLNRFIAGKRMYERDKVTFAYVVKTKFKDDADEMLVITEMTPEMTLDDVSKKISGSAKEVRQEHGNDMNDFLLKLSKLPRCVMSFLMCIFRWLDFHGWMPESICDGDSNYATVLVSNLGSIKCNACYHHLNDYGTNSIMMTIGKLHKEQVIDDEGNISIRDVVAIGSTVDERIADGFYFAKSIRLLEQILSDPKNLEEAISDKIELKLK